MSIRNSCLNKQITDANRQFNDILVVKQKEARWAGNQFMLIYLALVSMIFTYRYQEYYFPGISFWRVNGATLMLAVCCLAKVFVFQPLNTFETPPEFDDEVERQKKIIEEIRIHKKN